MADITPVLDVESISVYAERHPPRGLQFDRRIFRFYTWHWSGRHDVAVLEFEAVGGFVIWVSNLEYLETLKQWADEVESLAEKMEAPIKFTLKYRVSMEKKKSNLY